MSSRAVLLVGLVLAFIGAAHAQPGNTPPTEPPREPTTPAPPSSTEPPSAPPSTPAPALDTDFPAAAFTKTPSGLPPAQPMTAEMYRNMNAHPVVKLVTMGVGSLAWERHGHIALCIEFTPTKETCYNYGIGDFQHPLSMAWGFFRANNSFWVGKQNPRQMLFVYTNADRTVWVQPLPLTPEQKQKVIDKLEFDVLEENKHYSYDHLWDNCTTRVRDVLDNATDGAFKKMPHKADDRSFRDLARDGFRGLPKSWLFLLVTDHGMGRASDAIPTYWDRMFLPDYMREAVTDLWGIKPQVVYQRKGPFAVNEIEKTLRDGAEGTRKAELQARLESLKDESSGRLGFCLLVLLLTSPAWITRLVGRFQRVGMWVAVLPPVFLSLIFWMLSIVSRLPYVRWNETCLCLMPFDLLLVVLSPERRQKYARGRVIFLALVAALMLVDVVKAPIWPVWLWALVPNAVVAFMPVGTLTRASRSKPSVASTAAAEAA